MATSVHQGQFMCRRPGVILNKPLFTLIFVLTLWIIPTGSHAINIGSLTFSLAEKESFVAKRVFNNNQSARIYRITVKGIDRPGSREVQLRPADGELLFAPRQLALQAGEADFLKFYYRGPEDNRERYYRISFTETPTRTRQVNNAAGSALSMEPLVVVNAILVVRPRKTDFRWHFDRQEGVLNNTGNTWFKLLLKPGCESTEEEGETWYVRPGDILRRPSLQQSGQKFIVYNDKFISISDDCMP